MAKATKKTDKKPAKEASGIFHNITAASVKGNPKPKRQKPDNNKMGDHAANMG
jgi:hypothetical protein